MRTQPLPIILTLFGAVACSTTSLAPIADPTTEQLIAAPTQVAVNNVAITLSVEPWRDFQPSTRPDTRLMTVFRVSTRSGLSIPSNLHAEKAWLLRDREPWASTPRQEQPPYTPEIVDYMSRGGPTWPVGDLVIGVLLLRDAANNSYLLRSPPQPIGRTD